MKIDDNSIGDEGAKSIGEALKINKTLTQINLCIFMNFNENRQ